MWGLLSESCSIHVLPTTAVYDTREIKVLRVVQDSQVSRGRLERLVIQDQWVSPERRECLGVMDNRESMETPVHR